MALTALIISIVAAMASVILVWRALTLARHSNTMPVLIDLFREHRSDRLADARNFVYLDLSKYDLSMGLSELPNEKQSLVRDLAWFYDNLGTLVTSGFIDLEPVSGYLGQSILTYWERMEPLAQAERKKRQGGYDQERWQIYFENLYRLIQDLPPEKARTRQRMWRLDKPAHAPTRSGRLRQALRNEPGEREGPPSQSQAASDP